MSALGSPPGSPPEGHTEWADPDCNCVIQYGPDGKETTRWSCMTVHFPVTNPHLGRPA